MMRRIGSAVVGATTGATSVAPGLAVRMSDEGRRASAAGAAGVPEPGPVLGHARALVVGRAALARAGLGGALAGAPAQLDAVVGVVGHLEVALAGQHVGDGQLEGRVV